MHKMHYGDSIPRIRRSEPARRINVPFVVSRCHTVEKHFERTQLMSLCDFKKRRKLAFQLMLSLYLFCSSCPIVSFAAQQYKCSVNVNLKRAHWPVNSFYLKYESSVTARTAH